MSKLILASSSKSRYELLQRLKIDFEVCSPNVDETPNADETAAALVERLSICKAQAGANQMPAADWVIGSDQTADVSRHLLGKPGDAETAIEQLMLCADKLVQFHTGICFLNVRSCNYEYAAVTTNVHFRQLTEEEIKRYVKQEKPFACAGSFRSESLGISLFKKVNSDDPTALLGLPLITLSRLLRKAGFELP